MADDIGRGVDMEVGMAELPIFNDYSKRDSTAFDSGDVINLFLDYAKSGKKKFVFLNTPGINLLRNIIQGEQQSRLLYIYENFMYGIFGANVYRFGLDLVPVYLGSIGTSSGFVSAAVNKNNQIIFVDGQAGYLYKNDTNQFSKITAEGFPGKPIGVVCFDGYFVIPSGESTTFSISGLNDGESWDPTDIAQTNIYTGKNIGIGMIDQRIYFFQTDSVISWYDAGLADFPLRPDKNILFNRGCLTNRSIASGYGLLFWLERSPDGVGSVMMTSGQEAKPVSTQAEDELIASFSHPEDVTVYLYKMNDHLFLSINWTTDDVSLLYDVTMDMWFRQTVQEKKSIPGVKYSGNTRNFPNCHAYFSGKHLVGDYRNSNLYEMNRNYPLNNGEPIMRRITGEHFFNEDYLLRQINRVQLDMQMGIGKSGLGTGVYTNQDDDPITNPQVYLSFSRDNKNFGNECPAPIGKIGQTNARAIWRKKGQARDWVPRFTIYAPIVPIVILGASVDYTDLLR
jgi:hypothetical protein